MDVGGVIVNGDGKWVNTIYYNESSVASGITALTYDDLVGVVGENIITNLANCATLSFPQLKYSMGIIVDVMPALTTLSLASVVALGFSPNYGRSLQVNAAALTTFTLPTTLKVVSSDVSITAALTQASVDNVLARLAALDGTAGTVPFVNPRTVSITGTSATPSAAGLASKATLVARGVTVTHNP